MMKIVFSLLMIVGLIQAKELGIDYKNMHAKHKTFHTVKEFKHHKNMVHKRLFERNSTYKTRSRYVNHHSRYDRNRLKPQRGYRHPKRDWFYAYRYTKADFVDRYGFYYGYFDRRGYMFEGEFYRYDRDYRYQDRLRGKGLFDRHYFYRPLPRIYRDDFYR